jgi:hypothetical protein
MRGIVAKTAAVAAVIGGFGASFLVPLGLLDGPPAPEEALSMPAATRETTVSVFPAPGRPESSTAPLERVQPAAAQGRSRPAPRPTGQAPIRPTSPVPTRVPVPPIRPQTDERLLAELGPERPDDRSPRLLVAD